MKVKEYDKHPISWVANMDLTGATVRVIAREGAFVLILPATIEPGESSSKITHMLTGTLPEGRYRIEVEATIGGEIITFPNDNYARLDVVRDLDEH